MGNQYAYIRKKEKDSLTLRHDERLVISASKITVGADGGGMAFASSSSLMASLVATTLGGIHDADDFVGIIVSSNVQYGNRGRMMVVGV